MHDAWFHDFLFFGGLLAIALLFSWAARKLGRKWDEYDSRYEAAHPAPPIRPAAYEGSGRRIGSRHWNNYVAYPAAKLTLSKNGFRFTLPGTKITKTYDKIQTVRVTRFGALAFHLDGHRDSFTFTTYHIKRLLSHLEYRGVPLPTDPLYRIRRGEFYFTLLFSLTLIAAVAVMDLFIWPENDRDILSRILHASAFPLYVIIKSASLLYEARQSKGAPANRKMASQ